MLHVPQHTIHHTLSDATESVVHIMENSSLRCFELLDCELVTAHAHCPVVCRTTIIAEIPMGQRQGSENKDVWADASMMTCIGPHEIFEIPGIVGGYQGLLPCSCEIIGQAIKDAGSKGNHLIG